MLLIDDEVAVRQLYAEAHGDVLATGLHAVLLIHVLDEGARLEDGQLQTQRAILDLKRCGRRMRR